MAKTNLANSSGKTLRSRPALTPEGREEQLIAAAMNLVEQRILDGTATSQEVCHFLKLGTTKSQLEKEKLREENKLLRAKTQAIESSKEMAELYREAMAAFRGYRTDADD